MYDKVISKIESDLSNVTIKKKHTHTKKVDLGSAADSYQNMTKESAADLFDKTIIKKDPVIRRDNKSSNITKMVKPRHEAIWL